ncbi:MAG: permease-like cell division protein FtsX [Nocardioides sp.]
MQLRYVFSELRQGLRRNLSMHIAVILTLFVSLTLVGVGVLLAKQAGRAAEQWGSELEITVWLCRDDDDNPACTGEVSDAQKAAIVTVIEDNPEVADYRYESKERAFERVKELYGEENFEGPNPVATAEAVPASYWIELKEPEEFEGITSAVSGLDGVSEIGDQRSLLEPIYGAIFFMRIGSLVFAGFLVVAALLLVANTVRLAAFARRKEIGIMRLVGASTLYIALPFLMEAVVTALIGISLAAGALALGMQLGVRNLLAEKLRFISWIGADEYLYAMAVVGILGLVLTMIPTLLLSLKYLRV